jgi:hypothetical protein
MFKAGDRVIHLLEGKNPKVHVIMQQVSLFPDIYVVALESNPDRVYQWHVSNIKTLSEHRKEKIKKFLS